MKENVSRQVRRALERKLIRASLSKNDRRRLQRMKNPKRRALREAIISQAGK